MHSDQLLVSVYTDLSPFEEESIDEMQEIDDVTQEILTDSDDPSYAISKSSTPQLELNDVVRDLGFSKNSTEILAFRLQEKALLNKTTSFILPKSGTSFC